MGGTWKSGSGGSVQRSGAAYGGGGTGGVSGLLRGERDGDGEGEGEPSPGRRCGLGRGVRVRGYGVGERLIPRVGCGVRGRNLRGSEPSDGK